jgi:hypothetical protein
MMLSHADKTNPFMSAKCPRRLDESGIKLRDNGGPTRGTESLDRLNHDVDYTPSREAHP